jgi:hypothetical protein
LARETGWQEDYILRRLPLARALRYYHAALWAAGAWTVKGESVNAQVKALLAAVDAMRIPDDETDDYF